AAPNGRVLSTFPAALIGNCRASRRVFDGTATYCYLQGTSMASPHAAGVAALIASRGITNPGAVAAKLQNTADPIDCPPDLSIYGVSHCAIHPNFNPLSPAQTIYENSSLVH